MNTTQSHVDALTAELRLQRGGSKLPASADRVVHCGMVLLTALDCLVVLYDVTQLRFLI